MAIILDGTTGITTPAETVSGAITASTVTATGLISGSTNYTGFKNRIINGGMVIDQRNAGASVTVSSYGYVLDRFGFNCSGGGAFTVQRSTTAPTGFVNSQALTVSTPDSSIAAGDVYQSFHKIEGYNVADLNFGTVNAQTFTLSFWVRSSITGTYAVGLCNNAFNRSYVSTYTVNVANTWEQKTITVVGDTSGTWVTDNNIGLNISFDIGSGTNYNTTAGAWGAGNFSRTSGSVNWIATSGATFYITGVQLEKGSVATSFDYRPYGTELQLCQRYYEKSYDIGTAVAQNSGTYNGTSVAASPGPLSGMSFSETRYKVTKRNAATLTFYNPAAANAFARDQNAGVDCTATSAWMAGESSFAIIASTGVGSGVTNRVAVHWSANSEL